jgi:predicted P-loop ATPase
MIALCARTFEPGIKFDVVTIIRGNQGGRKSSFWEALAIGDSFFNE